MKSKTAKTKTSPSRGFVYQALDLRGFVYQALDLLYRQSPGCPGKLSWRDLNPALRNQLECFICAKVPFQPTEFRSIYYAFAGSHWFGDGRGSEMGEHFYSIACSRGHTSACVSFEQFAGRPPVLWEHDNTGTQRMHVGYKFVWQGLNVEVTSMREDSLVACHYGTPTHDRSAPVLSVGSRLYAYGDNSGYFEVATATGPADRRRITVIPAQSGGDQEAKPVRRFTLSYTDIASHLAKARAHLNAALTLIKKAATREALETVGTGIVATKDTYRHFDLEKLRTAFAAKKAAFDKAEAEAKKAEERAQWEVTAEEREAAQLKRWLAGEPVAPFFTGPVRLRLKGEYIETTNGQSALVRDVAALLPKIIAAQKAAMKDPMPCAYVLNAHTTITQLSANGVQAGCTLVPWPEVAALQKMISKQKTQPGAAA